MPSRSMSSSSARSSCLAVVSSRNAAKHFGRTSHRVDLQVIAARPGALLAILLLGLRRRPVVDQRSAPDVVQPERDLLAGGEADVTVSSSERKGSLRRAGPASAPLQRDTASRIPAPVVGEPHWPLHARRRDLEHVARSRPTLLPRVLASSARLSRAHSSVVMPCPGGSSGRSTRILRTGRAGVPVRRRSTSSKPAPSTWSQYEIEEWIGGHARPASRKKCGGTPPRRSRPD